MRAMSIGRTAGLWVLVGGLTLAGCLEDKPSASITQTGLDASGIGDGAGGADATRVDTPQPDAASDAAPDVSVDINADTPNGPDTVVSSDTPVAVDSTTTDGMGSDGTVADGSQGDGGVTTDGAVGDVSQDLVVGDGGGGDTTVSDTGSDIPVADGGSGDATVVDATPDAVVDATPDVAPDGAVVDAVADAVPDGVVVDAVADAVPDGGVVDAVADAMPDSGVVDAVADAVPDAVLDVPQPDATPDVVTGVTCAEMFNDCQPEFAQFCPFIDGSPCLDLLLADYTANGCPAACNGISIPGFDDFCTDPACGQLLTFAQQLGFIVDECTTCLCPVDCVPGETECNGDVLSTCTQTTSGCPTFVDQDCSLNGGFCDDGQDPAQCSSGGGTCNYEVCSTGPPPPPGCDDPCVQQICQADPFCCQGQWDNICVGAVNAVCGIDCSPGVTTCNEQYSNTSGGYYECGGGFPGECVFGHNTNALGSCGAFCQQQGGECIDVFNNAGQCGFAEQLACDQAGFQSVLCICSQGCGGGDPCAAGEVCVNDTCN